MFNDEHRDHWKIELYHDKEPITSYYVLHSRV